MNRREFLKGTAAAGAAAVLPLSILPETVKTFRPADEPTTLNPIPMPPTRVWTFMYGNERGEGSWDECANLFVWFENHPTSPDLFDVCVVGEFASGNRYRCWEGNTPYLLTSIQPNEEVIKEALDKEWEGKPSGFPKGQLWTESCTLRHVAFLLYGARGYRSSDWPKHHIERKSGLYVPDNWTVPKVMVADMRSYENE